MGKYIVIILSLCLAAAAEVAGQQRKTLEGLRDNTEYQTLVAVERALVLNADSLAREAAGLRRDLKTDTLARETISVSIVLIERQSADIRSQMAQVASRINKIEQEWTLESYEKTESKIGEGSASDAARTTRTIRTVGAAGNAWTAGSTGTIWNNIDEAGHRANLVHSAWFRSVLPADQLTELLNAQAAEADIPPVAALYRDTWRHIKKLAAEYEAASSQVIADEIAAELEEFEDANRATGEGMSAVWDEIFDSKSYIYNLLADRGNRPELLALFDEKMIALRQEQIDWADTPEPLRDYVLQKRLLTECEIALAQEIGNSAAVDSLRRVSKALPGPESLDEFQPIVIKQKLFLDFADIEFGNTPYSASNPIPEVKVWPQGVIWRVMLGSYLTRQSPSNFRGARPLAFDRNEKGRFRYFAGGFATDSLARVAVERLKITGFRNATAVVWIDGEMIDPEAESELFYRMEISGVPQLPVSVRETIIAQSRVDMVRSGENFIVSPLDGPAAVRLRAILERLKPAYPEMEAKLSKITE